MINVNVEENKKKRQFIVDNHLKFEKPFNHNRHQRVDNFEMLMAFCTLIKRQRPLLSKQSVDQITSMIDVVYNGISIDDGDVYHWKAKNGVGFATTKLLRTQPGQLHRDNDSEDSAISLNCRTLVVRETRQLQDEYFRDVLHIFDMSRIAPGGAYMNVTDITNDFDESAIEIFKLSPDGLYLASRIYSLLCVYDIYNESKPAVVILPPMYDKWVFDISDSSEGALVATTLNNYSFKVSSFTFGKNEPVENVISKCCIAEFVLNGALKCISQLAFVGDGRHIIAASNSLDVLRVFDYTTSTVKVKMEDYKRCASVPLLPNIQCVARGISIDRCNNLAIIRFGLVDTTSTDLVKDYYGTPDSYLAVDIASGKIVYNHGLLDHWSYKYNYRCVNNDNAMMIIEHGMKHNPRVGVFWETHYYFLCVCQTYSKNVIDVIACEDYLMSNIRHVYESFN